MAQWKETLEPYVKVIESVKSTPLNPSAGGDLILGAVILSDCGPAQPTLITSQSEFLATYAASELTKDYIKSLDSLYSGDTGSSLASTMWLNAYRLAGSASLLVCRASKADGILYSKPLVDNNLDEFIIKDSELLKKVDSFKIDIDTTSKDGWAIAVRDLGILGNYSDDNGPLYDYKVNNLEELVNLLNESDKFYCPKLTYQRLKGENNQINISGDSSEDSNYESCSPSQATSVLFEEVYLSSKFLDVDDLTNDDEEETNRENIKALFHGLAYLVISDPNGDRIIDLNDKAYSDFDKNEFKYYASNLYSSKSDLKVRIRRYNHNVVSPTTGGDKNWVVDNNILNNLSEEQALADFYEFTITDPSISSDPQVYNVGSKPGRGDITLDDLRGFLSGIYLNLPDDLKDLGLQYFDGINNKWNEGETITARISIENSIAPEEGDEPTVMTLSGTPWRLCNNPGVTSPAENWNDFEFLVMFDDTMTEPKQVLRRADSKSTDKFILGTKEYEITGKFSNTEKEAVTVSDPAGYAYAQFKTVESDEFSFILNTVVPKNEKYKYQEVEVNVKIKEGSALLEVSDSEIKAAWDKIEDDERYVVEGVSDLGCTYPALQNYIANIAVNSNYFYPFSVANTTNYMTIANSASKITSKSHKLYCAAPWDYDDGTVGFQYAVSPSVLYWETVMRNRRNNNEFAGVFGQNNGRVSVMKLAKEFKKSERQLLLTKKINSISYDNYLSSYYFNDNYTFTEDATVMAEECNSRLQIRISKAMPLLLNQFKGYQNTSRTWKQIREVCTYWFENTIMRYNFTIAEYRVICDDSNNTPESIRQNKVFVQIQVRFNSSIKFITVYNDAYPIGVEFSE